MEYLKKIKEIRKYWVFKLLGLDVVSKSGGAKEIRIYILELKLFLTFHDKQNLGKFGKQSSEGAKNEEHCSRVQSCNLIR